MDLPLTEDFGKEWTRAEHMNSVRFRNYVQWRDKVLFEARLHKSFEEPGDTKKDALHRINRQVALAIFCDLEYNFHKSKVDIERLTGKSQVYWNFQILGTTVKTDDGRKERQEQTTSDYFIASLLNRLGGIGHRDPAIEVDWNQLFTMLLRQRYRVIAVPAASRNQWEQFCQQNMIKRDINYPAPWHVANWAGLAENTNIDEVANVMGVEWNLLKTSRPARISRINIGCYGISDEVNVLERPSILKGLRKRIKIRKLVEEQQETFDASAFEKAVDMVARKYAALIVDLERRIKVKDEDIEVLTLKLSEMTGKLLEQKKNEARIKELEAEMKNKDKWGKEMKKRLQQINKLSWVDDIGRSLPKD